MTLDRRGLLAAGLGGGLGGGLVAARAEARLRNRRAPAAEPVRGALPAWGETIVLWPAGAPGAPAVPPVEQVDERSTDPLVNDRSVHGIVHPRMVVFRPERPNGAAVLVTPGGGYRLVVVDKEGFEIGRWLAARGFTAFVLFYRLPGEGWANPADTPLADAQRALRLIRLRAPDYGIDPARVAALGFSAGGHVCADLAARFAAPVYAPIDAADRLSARPFCAAPLYPVVAMDPAIAHPGSRRLLLGAAPTAAAEAAHSPDLTLTAAAPPHFLLHAEDDAVVPVENTLRLHAALRMLQVPVELHLFAHGGHGFGLRKAAGQPVAVWPQLWRAWARETGLG